MRVEDINLVGLFVNDHKRIVALLNEFKRSKRNKTAKTIFEQLDYSLRLHFKEEEYLYSKYKQKTGEFLGSLQTIKKEHETIIGYLDAIRRALNNSSKINIKEFFPLLERHKNIEERLLYPELDNALTEKEKEDVYWKIKVK